MSQKVRISRQAGSIEKYGQRFYNPTLGGLCITIAWATTYSNTGELDETHPMWKPYFAYSEWFRHLICAHLEIPFDTVWMEIYRKVGTLVDEEYPTPEDARTARNFGEGEYLQDEMVPIMFDAFEHIKFQIVGRI